mgnify:CR=1 FL=1
MKPSSSEELPKLSLKDHFTLRMTPNAAAHWKYTREKGMLRYVLLWGAFAMGGLFAAFAITLKYFDGVNISIPLILGKLTYWAIPGLGLGFIVWKSIEKEYRKHKKKDEQV